MLVVGWALHVGRKFQITAKKEKVSFSVEIKLSVERIPLGSGSLLEDFVCLSSNNITELPTCPGIKQLKSIMLRKKHFKRYYTYVSSILKEI